MILSADRVSQMTHLILEKLRQEGLVEIRDQGTTLQRAKESLQRRFAEEDAVDTAVRERLQKQKKNPGTREWQLLYDRYVREELHRRR